MALYQIAFTQVGTSLFAQKQYNYVMLESRVIIVLDFVIYSL